MDAQLTRLRGEKKKQGANIIERTEIITRLGVM
jgi:hypothetical protein